jgi:uncharacterized SAM-binding protein YcdF (DUF218 family)
MFLISKLTAPLISPLGIVLVALVLALLLSFSEHRRLSKALVGLAFLLLWAGSMPFGAGSLAGLLDADYPAVPVSTSPGADVIVVLGGTVLPPARPGADVELAAADRLMHAADLYKAGKAKVIIASGGNWGLPKGIAAEAVGMREVLEKFGVPASAIIVETKSRNTHENALDTAAILKQHSWNSPLLVTSAIHMPRAVASFVAEGINVSPSPADFIGAGPSVGPLSEFLPDAHALAESTDVVKELVGNLYYRLRGWAR